MMKYRIYILPLLLGPMSATAYELDLYYDLNGNYDTFCTTNYVGLGDCPNPVDQTAVAEKLMALAAERDEVLGDIKLSDGTTLINSNGEFQLTGTQVNAKGLDQTTTLQTNNECKSGNTKNKNGVCVNATALSEAGNENGNDYATYIDLDELTPQFNSNGVLVDFGGGEVSPDDVGGNDKGGCGYYSKFKVQIHWCPESYETFTWRWANTGTTPQGWTADEGPDLWPTSGCVNGPVYDYEWKNRTSLAEGNATYKLDGAVQTKIEVPPEFTNNNWQLRGFYLLNYPQQPSGCTAGVHTTNGNNLPSGCIQYWGYRNTIAQNLVTTADSNWGTARLGLGKANNASLIEVPINDVTSNFANSRWAIWSCSPIPETRVFHLYAGWARDCDAKDGATCTLGIRRTGLYNSNNKGDAFYTTGCSGSNQTLVSGANTYHPVCSTNSASNCTSSQHFCYVGAAPQCVARGESSSACCNDNLGACNKESACCVITGGTWDDTDSSCSGGNYTWNSGTCISGGSTPPPQ